MASSATNLWVLLGLGLAGILLMTKKLKKAVREDFGAFVERFQLLPPPQPLPPKAPHLLTGLTFAVSDLFDINGHVTGFGNADWARTHETASATAFPVAVMVDGGATCVGKTVTDEMAFSLSGENKHYDTPTNPAAPSRVPGGCSSGASVAVAAGIVDFSLGVDTIGGVRLPAAFCGVLGFRSSYGAVPHSGVIPVSTSLDTVGLFAKDPNILRRAVHVLLQLQFVSRWNPRQIFMADDCFKLIKIPIDRVTKPVIRSTEKLYGRQILKHENLGEYIFSKAPSLRAYCGNKPNGVKSAALKSLSDAMLAVFRHEFKQNHEEWMNSVKPSLDPLIKSQIDLVKEMGEAEIQKLHMIRYEVRSALNLLLKDDGILVLPTCIDLPPKLGGKDLLSEDYQSRLFSLLCIASMSGCCQMTVPLGYHNKCPVSVSFIARHGGDRFLVDTVQTMYTSLQEEADVASKTKTSSNAVSRERSADIAKEKGNEAFKEKQWQKAVSFYTEAIKLNDRNATYYSNRAAAFLELGSFIQAEADCTQAIGLDKKNVKSYLRRGTAREMLGYYKEAIEGVDTIGGVRLPAAFCGVLGFRSSYGAVPHSGVIPVSTSLDTVGLFAKDPNILRRAVHVLLQLQFVSRWNPRQIFMADDCFKLIKIPIDRVTKPVIRSTEKLYGRQILKHENLGEYIFSKAPSLRAYCGNKPNGVKSAALKSLSDAMLAVFRHEFKQNHEEWMNSVKPSLDPLIKSQIDLVKEMGEAEIQKLHMIRYEVRSALNLLLKDDGILVLPTCIDLPPKLGGKDLLSEDYQSRLFSLLCIASMSGCCQMTVPLGYHNKCPVSVSFIARHGGDRFLVDTVQTMYTSLQEEADVASKTKTSSNAVSRERSADIAKEKGNEAFKEKQWQKAVSFYTEAIKLNDRNATYYSNRAAAFLELGSFIQAEADCTQAIGLDKKNVKSYLRRGTAREMLGYYKEAIEGVDTIGGVRLPAAFCGVLGFRSSYGAVPHSGVIPVSTSLDTVGLFAKDPNILRRAVHVLLQLQFVSRWNPRQIFMADDCFKLIKIPIDRVTKPVIRSTEKLYGRQILKHENLGEYIFSKAPSLRAYCGNKPNGVKSAALKSLSDAMLAVFRHEFKQNHEEWMNSVKPSLDPLIKSQIDLVKEMGEAEIQKLHMIRYEVRSALNLLLKDDGILVLPTCIDLPPKLGGKDLLSEDYQSRLFSLLCIASMSGCCQMTVPLGYHNKCPVSVSFIARHGGDRFLVDTVQTMYTSLQEEADVASKTKTSSNAVSRERSADIAKEKGNEAFKEKQWQKAVSFYTEAIKLNDRNATYYSNRAAAFLELGSFIQAEADCTQAIGLDKKNVKSYLRRGTAREMLGYYKEAIEDFKYALVLEPTNKRASVSAERLRSLFIQ